MAKLLQSILLIFLLLSSVEVRAGLSFSEDETDFEKAVRVHLRGVVVDENKEPLAGATVMLANTAVGAGTNSEGKFSLKVKHSKAYKIVVSFIGYETKTVEVLDNARERITVELEPMKSALEEVVVTGTRTEKPLKNVPVITRIISSQNIKALNPMDIETLLQYELPGLQFRYNTMSESPTISYQGMDGKYILFLIDGERVSGEGADSNVDFSRFNIDQIERIEVVKGAQSTLYGSNALGAVINIITKKAERPIEAGIDGRYGNHSGQKYSTYFGVKKDRFTSYSSFSYRQKDNYTIEDNGTGQKSQTINLDGTVISEALNTSFVTVRGYKAWDLSHKMGYVFNDKLNANLKTTYYKNTRGQGTRAIKFDDVLSDLAFNGSLKYLVNKNNKLEFSTVYDRYIKDKKFKLIDKQERTYDNRTLTSRLNYTGVFNDSHNLTAGLEFNYESLKHYMFKNGVKNNIRYYVAYAQEDWRINNKLNLVAGLRADWHSKYSLHITPKLSLMYKPIDNITLRGGYAHGFKSPTLKELYMEYDMGNLGLFYIYGNENLKPETSRQYSASAEYSKGDFYASLSAQYNKFRDKIGRVYVSSNNSSGYKDMKYMNTEDSKSYSLEAITKYRTGFGLTMQASYSFTKEYEYYKGYNISFTPPHSINFNLMYNRKFGKTQLTSSMNGQWISGLTSYNPTDNPDKLTKYEFSPRFICSINTKVAFPRGISLSLGVDNLFNYKDTAVNAGKQLPQLGIGFISSLSINIAELLKI